MVDSILTSVKKLLGITAEDTNFDTDIIMFINSAFLGLQQLGIGPSTGFMITSAEEEWSSLLGDRIDIEAAKIYVFLKTRLVFDPPQSGFLVDAIKNQITELEFRLNVQSGGG